MPTGQKLDPKFVESYIESCGYKALEPFTSTKKPMSIQCPAGHTYAVRFSSFRKGTRCKVCQKKIADKNLCLTQKEAEIRFLEKGCTLLSNYEKASIKVSAKCSKGHIFEITPANFFSTGNCNICSKDFTKLTLSNVQDILSKKGLLLISPYKNSVSKLTVKCVENNHIYETTFAAIRGSKHGCKLCCDNYYPKYTNSDIRDILLKRGYTLIGIYENSTKPFEAICPKNHKCMIRITDFNKGIGCRTCSGNLTKTQKEVAIEVETVGYKLLSEYKNNQSKLLLECPEGHLFNMSRGAFYMGQRCPACSSGFNPSQPAILYYLKFRHATGIYYKIGITNKTIKTRFYGEPTPYEIIKEERFDVGQLARQKEQQILKTYSNFRYAGDNVLVSGNTELFIIDVLGLDV